MINGLLLSLGIASFLYALRLFYPITIDDAFITFAYAKNAAVGNGFVFSPGEYVEATSSFLWAALILPFELLGIGSVIGAKILGILSAIGALSLTAALLRNVEKSTGAKIPILNSGIIAVTSIAVCTAFLAWSFQGMENSLVAFLIMWSFYAFHREFEDQPTIPSYIPLILLEAARPEGFIFWLTFAATRLLLGLMYRKHYWFLSWFLKLAAGILCYELFGLWYYGHLLPNTVGAKVSGYDPARVKAGIEYLLSRPCFQVCALGLASIPYLLITCCCLWKRDIRRLIAPQCMSVLIPAIILSVVQAAFIVQTGGDWMPAARFISHLAPVYALLTVSAWALAFHALRLANFKYRFVQIVIVFSILPVLARHVYTAPAAFTHEHAIAKWINDNSERAIVPIVEYIQKNASTEDVIACSDVGRVGYFFKGKVFDWWGLASPEVVRRGEQLGKIKANTVLEVNPRYVVLYSGTPNLSPTEGLIGFGGMSTPFMESPEFLAKYRQVLSTQFTDFRYHILFERI